MASWRSSSRFSVTAITGPCLASAGKYIGSFSVAVGKSVGCRGDGGVISAPSRAFFSAAMCPASVPQQPPKMATPACKSSGTSAVNSSGGQLYTALPSTICGIPALGLAMSGTRAYSRSRRSCTSISWGPAEQFRPKASTPMPCIITRAAVMSVPETVRPFSSQVKVTKMGLSLTLRTASTAARASERVIMVSITNRSTPASSSPAAWGA